jgi:hypothetical protein
MVSIPILYLTDALKELTGPQLMLVGMILYPQEEYRAHVPHGFGFVSCFGPRQGCPDAARTHGSNIEWPQTYDT